MIEGLWRWRAVAAWTDHPAGPRLRTTARIEQISDQHVYVAFDPGGEIASTDFSIEFCFVDVDADGNTIGIESVGPVAEAITTHLRGG
jgi:uncharacterized protein YuzE